MKTGSQVAVWTWRLDPADDRIERLAACLSAEERARANRFVSPLHRRRSIVAHGVMRDILGSACGIEPSAISLGVEPEGKPFVVAEGRPAPFFNLTHSEDWAALALSWDSPVGIDIEAIRPLAENVAERFFSPRERSDLATLDAATALRRFYALWTCKEALLKATGWGLTIPLDSFDVVFDGGTPRLARFEESTALQGAWDLVAFAPAAGLAGAVAARAASFRLTVKPWPHESAHLYPAG